MSTLYPQLFDDDEKSEEKPAPAPAPAAATAPEDKTLGIALEKYKNACGLCQNKLDGMRTTIVCGHDVHVQCVMKTAETKKVALEAIGGMNHCGHCRDSIAQGFSSAEQVFDAQKTEQFCINQLYNDHKNQYPKLNIPGSFEASMTYDRMLDLMGQKKGTFQALQKAASSAKFFTPLLSYIGKSTEETPAAEQQQPQEVVLSGADFIAECHRRNISIDEILGNGGNIGDLWNLGLQSMSELQSIGFVPARHFAFRSVLPIYVLAQKYDANYATHMRDYMTNQQLIECNLTKYELPLIGFTAHHLVERGMNQRDMYQFKNMKLEDWIRYAGLQVTHAIQMKMTGTFIGEMYADEMVEGSSAYKLYCDLKTVAGKRARAAAELRKNKK
jgi:hypothetical protein